MSRDLGKTEVLGVSSIVASLLTALLAAGLQSTPLWMVAGTLFVVGDVLLLIGGSGAD